jgi:hypothetical protein
MNQNQESPLPENDFFLKFNPKNKPFQVEHKPTMYIFYIFILSSKHPSPPLVLKGVHGSQS